jgi:outer membrane immunogenic protein
MMSGRLVKSLLTAAVFVTAATCLHAADMPLKAAAPVPVFSWTGHYVGAYAGGAWATNDYATPDAVCQFGGFFCPGGASGNNQTFFQGAGSAPARYDLSSSVAAGVTAGFNWQLGKTVVGLEGEAGYVHMSGAGQFLTNGPIPCRPATPLTPPCSNYAASSTFGDWYGTIAARVGITADALFPTWSAGDHALLYVKAGPALGVFRTGVAASNFPGASFATINFSNAQTVWGVVAGAGVEWAFDRNWSLKAEYEYLSFERATQACGPLLTTAGVIEVPGSTFCTSTTMHGINIAKVGINYRFSDRLWPF